MRHRSILPRLSTSLLLIIYVGLLATCGIPTAPTAETSDEIQEAAVATSELQQYAFTWSADYELTPTAEITRLRVTGSGTVDVTTGDVEALVTYDEAARSQAEQWFPGVLIETITAETRVIGDEVFVRGLNAGFGGDPEIEFDRWYRVTDVTDNLTEPFVDNEVRPADVLPVLLGPLTDDAVSVEVDRDFILDLGTRFSGSLFDFGLRIGGGHFEISAEREGSLIRTVRLAGDDAEVGVDAFVFEIDFEPLTDATITAPVEALEYP